MEAEREYLIPDYFSDFKCKMGACRTACCVGWAVSVSMTDYFGLLGLDCNEDLRRRLDTGMRLCDRRSEETYARFEPRYDGNCPMRMEDGRCALHAELGEEVLPTVCRLYPRGIRLEDGVYECSCANSCEAVLELFLNRTEPISFIRKNLPLLPPPIPERQTVFATLGKGAEIRKHLIGVIQDRTIPLWIRIIEVANELESISELIEKWDAEALMNFLDAPISDDIKKMKKAEGDGLVSALNIMLRMLKTLDNRSISICDYGEAALNYYGEGDGVAERYLVAKRSFEERFPNWENFFEHILVNHMFFSVFPYQDRPEDMRSEMTALCAIYAFMRFLIIGYMAEHDGETEYIDAMAAAFRLIDHTDFDRYSVRLLKQLGCNSPKELCDLVSI